MGVRMRLRTKILLSLTVILGLYTILNFLVQRLVIFPKFVALERKEAIKDLDRVVDALDKEVDHLSLLCNDWAAWDDTYDFSLDRSQKYIQANLVITSFTSNNLNLIFFYDPEGRVIWGEIHDLESEELLALKEFSSGSLPRSHPLLAHGSVESRVNGLIKTEKGPLLVVSRPILTSQEEGPIRGAVVMGRFISARMVETLAGQTKVGLKLWQVTPEDVPKAERPVLDLLKGPGSTLIKEDGDRVIYLYRTLPALTGGPALLIKTETPREISAEGKEALFFGLTSLFGVGALILMVLFFVLQATIIKPLAVLTDHALNISQRLDLSVRLRMNRADEIGLLSKGFDLMMDKVADYIKERQRAEAESTKRARLEGILEMAGATCHELNQPLQIIFGQIDLDRLSRSTGEHHARRMNIIEREIARMDQITRKISELTNPESIEYADGTKIIDLDRSLNNG